MKWKLYLCVLGILFVVSAAVYFVGYDRTIYFIRQRVLSPIEFSTARISPQTQAETPPSGQPLVGLANTPWPMYLGDATRSGRSRFSGPKRGVIRWKFPIEGLFEASPVIGLDGTIYVGSHNCKFYAVGPNGQLRWTFATRDMNRNSAAVAKDGTLYFPSADKSLYALHPDGEIKWVFRTGGRVNSSPAIGTDGAVYFGSHDQHLYALTPDGQLKWKCRLGTISASSPALSEADGALYIGAYDGHLYAVTLDGQIKWKFAADSGLRATPTVDSDGTVYIGSRGGTFYAVEPDGRLKWRYQTADDIRASAVIGHKGTVYVGSWDSYFYAFNPDGKRLWRYKANGPIEAAAIVDADGNIYVGALTDKIYSFTPEGKVRWTFPGGMLHTAPAIDADGALYICREHNLLAIGEPYPEMTWDTQLATPEGKPGVVILKLTNIAQKVWETELKVFVRTPTSQRLLLTNREITLESGACCEERLKLPPGGEAMDIGYWLTARLLDPIDGTVLQETSLQVCVQPPPPKVDKAEPKQLF
jgi:outer membrane protein assembly factor BamB